MVGEGVRQPSRQVVVQDLQAVRHPSQALHFLEKLRTILSGWSRAFDIEKGNGVTIPILDTRSREATEGENATDKQAKTEEQKQIIEFLYAGQGIGRPFVAPPDLPPERLKILRAAFDATMKDPEFVADVKKAKFELEPEDGEHLAALIKKIYATPRPIVDKVGNLIK